MWNLRACAVCLSTDVKLKSMDDDHIRRDYNLVSGLKTCNGNGLPAFLCTECAAYVLRCKKFRDKCQRAYFALREVVNRNKEIDKTTLKAFDRKLLDIAPTLNYADMGRVNYETLKFKWVKHSRSIVDITDEIPILQYSTENDKVLFEVPHKKIRIENCRSIKLEGDNINSSTELANDNNNSNEFEQQTPNLNNSEELNLFDDVFDEASGVEYNDYENLPCPPETEGKDADADGSAFDEEYANIVPITINEAKAVADIHKMFGMGTFKCDICKRSYFNENRLKTHKRMHEKHISGIYFCDLCHFYYKTEFLLKTHMNDKHMFKYVCKKCPEVSFDRRSAKQHYHWAHIQKNRKVHNWCNSTKPRWLSTKGGKRTKGASIPLRSTIKKKELPSDYPIYTPVTHEEQYQLVQERKISRNFIESLFKCQLCYRGFRELGTYDNHMKKHDPAQSGNCQCDVCKLYFVNTRKMYKHMITTHLFKYSCQLCKHVCFSKCGARMHYKWHKDVTYPCPHCEKEFKKISTQLTHIRIKHPSTYICDICGHSFVSENGLYCHKKISHSQEEREESSRRAAAADRAHPLYCGECGLQFRDDAAFATHFGSSNKHALTNLSIKPVRVPKKEESRRRGRPSGRRHSEILNVGMPMPNNCEICSKYFNNDVEARKHYEAEHPGTDFLKRYMCDICGHTTKQYANLQVHMRTHTREKPYSCPHCERRFSMLSNRDRHLVVHTGEKRYQCQHCNRRFTQSSAVKLHIQTVHLKIPYAPWNKKNRKRRKEMETAAATAACMPPPQHKYLTEAPSDYINAYITYNDE